MVTLTNIFIGFLCFALVVIGLICILTGGEERPLVKILGVLLIGGGGFLIYDTFIFDYTVAIDKALSRNDFEEAERLLAKMSQNEKDQDRGSIFLLDIHESNYSKACQKVMKSQITYLINQGDETSADRIVNILLNIHTEESPVLGISDSSSAENRNEWYNKEAGKFNAYCDEILNTAISRGNKYLAEKIVSVYKPTVIRSVAESHFFGSDEYLYEYSEDVKNAAKSKLYDAVVHGSFENLTSYNQSQSVEFTKAYDKHETAQPQNQLLSDKQISEILELDSEFCGIIDKRMSDDSQAMYVITYESPGFSEWLSMNDQFIYKFDFTTKSVSRLSDQGYNSLEFLPNNIRGVQKILVGEYKGAGEDNTYRDKVVTINY